MRNDPREIFDAAMQLPEADRLMLVSRLMASLPLEDTAISLDDPELVADLDRRFAQDEAGVDWLQLKAEG